MAFEGNGELIPVGGGDPIPLIRPVLVIGRRETCDIPLKFHNISSRHAELTFQDGYWHIRDLGSTNGIRVNGARVMQKPLRPGDQITIGKRPFVIEYTPTAGRRALEEMIEDDVMSLPLLEKAGLIRPKRPESNRPKPKPQDKPKPPPG